MFVTTNDGEVLECGSGMTLDSNEAIKWLQENCTVNPGHAVDCKFLYKKYKESDPNGIDVRRFGMAVKKAFPDLVAGVENGKITRQLTRNKKVIVVYVGIQFVGK